MLKAQVNVSDSLVLMDIYKNMDGENWKTKWDTTARVSTWFGVYLANNRVERILLGGNNLSGELPASVVNLDQLSILNFYNNKTTGQIPDSIGNLSKLTDLNFGFNKLSGELPESIGNLKNLQRLDLNRNELTGNIPDTLYTLSNLTTIYFSNNQFSGSISPKIGQLTKLEGLYLNSNNFNGAIPETIGALTELKSYYMGRNQFTSTPEDLYKCTNLEALNIEYNPITTIPATYADFIKLRILNISGLNIGPNFPDFILALSNLNSLFLTNCGIEGEIPKDLASLNLLSYLNLSYNKFSGNIPVEVLNFPEMNFYYLHSNKLEGTLPETGYNLPKIRHLNISENDLSGSIPEVIGSFKTLQSLSLNNNAFSGHIPDTLGALSELTSLFLSNNKLVGSVSEKIAQLTKITRIYIVNNNISSIPLFTNHPNLRLYISKNKLTFSEIVPQTEHSLSFFSYSPQDSVGEYQHKMVEKGASVTLVAPYDKVENFTWYKNGTALNNTDSVLSFNEITLADSGIYYCKMTNSKVPNLTLFSAAIKVAVEGVNSIENKPIQPLTYRLEQNYPNPFNPSTTIQFQLAKAGDVSITLYNVQGQLVKTLLSGPKEAGAHQVTFNAASLSSGVYYYKIKSVAFNSVKRMILIK